jgi:DNA-binding beta-propeller fold protein YncE
MVVGDAPCVRHHGNHPRHGKTAYVASDNTGTVTPISTADNQPGTPIKVGRGPGPIAITP